MATEDQDHGHDHVTAGRNAVEKEWQGAWYDGTLKEANRETTKWLKENIDKLTGGKKGLRIFVPMCGAARDMQWLLEQGHEVIGVDIVEKAFQIFMKRHDIKHSVSDLSTVKDGKCYKSEDGKLTLFKCNIFDLDVNLVGKVDGVWDSGAMTDIPPPDRNGYAEIILSTLSPGGRILAETFTFGLKEGTESSHEEGGEDFPCRPVEMEDFQRMYGKRGQIEFLAEEDDEGWDNYWCKNRLHLVTVK